MERLCCCFRKKKRDNTKYPDTSEDNSVGQPVSGSGEDTAEVSSRNKKAKAKKDVEWNGDDSDSMSTIGADALYVPLL